jgi:pyrroline-5-carboxylate reductase
MLSEMKLAVLGAGNIGGALIAGLLETGQVSRDSIRATVLDDAEAAEASARLKIPVVTTRENAEVVAQANVVVVCVKPHQVSQVIGGIRDAVGPGHILITIAAAVPLATVEGALEKPAPVFRVMPNLAMTVRESATAICANSVASDEQRALVEAIFQTVGSVTFIPEAMMHAVTALAGSGPAFVCTVLEGLISGAVKVGLPHAVATAMAEQMVLGTAKRLRADGTPPAVLRDQVTTPGGTTIAGLHELEKGGLRASLMSAVEAATKRSQEIEEKL